MTVLEKLMVELLTLYLGGLKSSPFQSALKNRKVGIYDPICTNRFYPGIGMIMLGGIAPRTECELLIDSIQESIQKLVSDPFNSLEFEILKNNFSIVYQLKDERIHDHHARFVQFCLYRSEIPPESVDHYLKKITLELIIQYITSRFVENNSFQILFTDGDKEIQTYFSNTERR